MFQALNTTTAQSPNRLSRQLASRSGLGSAWAIALALTLNLAVSQPLAQALQGPQAPTPLPTFELDKKGQRAHIDFSLKFNPISDPKLQFSQFANRKLLVFYFSAQCPHCQHAAPHVQKLSDQLAEKGFQTVAIAIARNEEPEIRDFIRNFRIRMPVFHDNTRQYGDKYGNGFIPLLFMVNEKGEYLRFKSFDANETPQQIMTEANLFAQK